MKAKPHLIAALLPVLFELLIFGTRIADPTNTSWITGDAATMQFGWEQYRADAANQFALITDRASTPMAMPVAMFDNLPLIVWFLKLVAPVLPEKFQYFGPMFLIGAALQGLFGFLAIRELTLDLKGWEVDACRVLGALFIGTAPVLYVRLMMTHPPLTMQWLIVAGIWIYARSSRSSMATTFAAYAGLLFFTGGINPYLLVMTTFVYAAFLIKLTATKQWSLQRLAVATLPIVAGVSALVLCGFVDPGSDGVLTGTGYGYYSANLNVLINPLPDKLDSTNLLGSTFLPPLPITSPGQYEGYGYLGLGGIMLVFGGLFYARQKGQLYSLETAPLLLAALGAFLFALSAIISIGSMAVQVPLPETLFNILQTFRSSGRMIWVTIYILLALGVVKLILLLSPRRCFTFLLGLAALQVADLAGPFAKSHTRFMGYKSVRFTDPAYAKLGRAHDTLLVLSPSQCGPWNYELGENLKEYDQQLFEPISFLASDNKLRTNSFYAGRLRKDQAAHHCVNFPREFLKTQPSKRTVYLLSPVRFERFGAHVAATHFCDFAEGLFVCRADAGRIGISDRAKSKAAEKGKPSN